jgi:fructuronate reductase
MNASSPFPILSDRTLADLPKTVLRPGYERGSVMPGIVHLGLGGFHRSHQAVYTDDCLKEGTTDWGIIGVSLRSSATRDALAPQDNLYTLAIRSGDAEQLRVIGALTETIVAPENPPALLARLTDPRIRIVSLTITEKGYMADLASGELIADHPDIRHDIANPMTPRSALGYLAAAIRLRRDSGIAPFTVLCCDNLPHNGRLLKDLLVTFADLSDRGLGAFIAEEIACPGTMVDRIVPMTGDADRARIATMLGLSDAWPVVTEPFSQWVIEDRFSNGRPLWERHGAEFVSDVTPYEQMKLRMLNGSHSAIAAIGRPLGLETVAELIGDPPIRSFVGLYWAEVAPTLDRRLGYRAYGDKILARFDNTALRHKTSQLATDASQKIPQRILPPLMELRSAGRDTPMMTFALAAWIRSCSGQDEAGRDMPLNDPVFERWTERPDQRSASAKEIVAAYLEHAGMFAEVLRSDPSFAAKLTPALQAIRSRGMRAALQDLIESRTA